jgi:hypothetical protein
MAVVDFRVGDSTVSWVESAGSDAEKRSPGGYMKYLCLVYGEESKMETIPDAECMQVGMALERNGHKIAAEALQPIATATTLRVRNGKVTITDGPFAETKEQLAGFYLIEAADLDEALRLAADIPPARIGSIEVRPIRELRP